MSYITQRGQGLLNTNKLCIQQPCRKRSEGRLKRYESCNDVRAMHADEYIRSVYLLGLVSNFKSLKNIAASYLLSNCNLQISSKDLEKMCLPKKCKRPSKRSSSVQSSSGVSSVKNKSIRSQEYSSKDSDTNNEKWMFGKSILTNQLSTEQKIMQLGSQIDADKTVISQLAKNLRMRNIARKKLLTEKKKQPNYRYNLNIPSEQHLQDPIETLTTYKVNYMLRCANAVRCKKQQPSEYKRN